MLVTVGYLTISLVTFLISLAIVSMIGKESPSDIPSEEKTNGGLE